MDAAGLAALLSAQDGVVSRAQLVGAAHEPHDLERLLRRKELFVALPGVYVNHNGPWPGSGTSSRRAPRQCGVVARRRTGWRRP